MEFLFGILVGILVSAVTTVMVSSFKYVEPKERFKPALAFLNKQHADIENLIQEAKETSKIWKERYSKNEVDLETLIEFDDVEKAIKERV